MRSAEAGILTGYFAQRGEARRVYKELEKKGFRRAALVSRGTDGQVHTWDPFLWRRALGALLGFVLLGALAGVLAISFEWPQPVSGSLRPLILPILLAGLVGSLASALWLRRAAFGVDTGLLERQGRWVLPGETVLILQAPVEKLHVPVAVLRGSEESRHAIFVRHPKREMPAAEKWQPGVLLSLTQIQEHSRRLATSHQVAPQSPRNIDLLRRLERSLRWVHQVTEDLAEASRLEQSVSPVAQWLLDNEYLVESHGRSVERDLPRRFYQELPALASEPDRGLPRIYALARELVSHTDLRLDREQIEAAVEAYQSVTPLSQGELWAFPQMLRTALIENIQQLAARAATELREREHADFWAHRLITANRRDPNQLFAILADLTESQPRPSPYFASQLLDYLYDEGAALVPVQSWLERTFRKSLNELNLQEQNRQTRDQISIGNAFNSLRQLSLLDWRRIFERLSGVERLLRLDPSGVYPRMNFDTRDRYRRAVEELARGTIHSEGDIARRAIETAAKALQVTPDDECGGHVGTYLVGAGRQKLARLLGAREVPRLRMARWVRRHHSAVYLLGLTFLTALFGAFAVGFGLRGQPAGLQLLIALLALIPLSQLALEFINYAITRMLPPSTLPKMDFTTSGIPDAWRTLVVVPTLLKDTESLQAEVERLEVRYLANPETNLLFALFTDFADANQEHREDDETLLQGTVESIEALNERHGQGRFYLFHRERRWNESEQAFIGWERKRGKLEELNALIDGTRAENAEQLVHVGDPDRLPTVRFVITLDSDTQLPRGAARRMVETLAHPLNQPRLDDRGRVVAGTYTIIQPRVSPSLPSASASSFSRLFADAVGMDPYTKAVSDAHQDLTGEGSYHGKGIYDARVFSRVLHGRFPENLLLSHDLIEGAHVRVGLASDIELYDEFPQEYLSYSSRQHRWIRGDWQIADWILPRVPQAGGRRGPNPLSWFNRWKIFDNLRRSLVPAASMSLLFCSWLISPALAWVTTLLVTMQLLFHPLAQPFTMATTRGGLRGFSLAKARGDMLRAVIEAALLPHQTALSLDAILRVWYRRVVSQRRLLNWTSAQALHGMARDRRPWFVISMGLASIFSGLVGWAVLRVLPANAAVASPWLCLWFISPAVGWWLSRRSPTKQRRYLVSPEDRRFLRSVVRRTWRYFDDFVGEETSWLPPDNYQVSHQNRLAMRTSPTNIGFWMISVLAVRDFGYVTADQVVERLTHTLRTLDRLERHEGHLLNWYDIQSLQPMEPRYVSMVDSGNLLGSLWAVQQGLREVVSTAVVDRRAFDGLQDTAHLLAEATDRDGATNPRLRELAELNHVLDAPPDGIVDLLRRLRQAGRSAEALVHKMRESTGVDSEVIYWAEQLLTQASAWQRTADLYLNWVEILFEKEAGDLIGVAEPLRAFRQRLRHAPSIVDLAAGESDGPGDLAACLQNIPVTPGPVAEWHGRLAQALAESQRRAGELVGSCQQLATGVRGLAEAMNMRFLYDTDRRLFAIGYSVTDGRRDSAHYDLLASEARLGSFVAIARGDVPVEHWFSMNRPYNAIGRRQVLLSWTGTMFEYLMPLLFQHAHEHSLLDKAAKEAVAIHMEYGRRRRVPWGVSESAYGDLDIHQTYQYKAFGVPELGLQRGLEAEVVVAPYASLLAVDVEPRETMKNLRRLADLGLLHRYGYYEAIDFSRRPSREGERGVIVRAYMAHHQGMGLLALTNFLCDGSIKRRFCADPRVRAVESLLHERIPIRPPLLHHVSTRDAGPSVVATTEVAPSASRFDTPHTATPKTQLLCNGHYGLMVTNTGSGYSQWGDFEITRWRADRTCDTGGVCCYIQDLDSQQVWSNTYQPSRAEPEDYSALLALDRAQFRRTDHDIQTETEVIVSPEEDVEIRRLTLINRSTRRRRLDLASYIELCLAPHNADRQHPAFNKLFIQTEALPELRALLAYRRPRSDDEPPIFVAHRMTSGIATLAPLRFETDRKRFIGRGRSLAHPSGMVEPPGNSQGFVLDPIFSLRQAVTLDPGKRVQVSMLLAAAETREQVTRLMSTYGDPKAIDRAMDLAWASAQLELRLLRIKPDDARRFQQLASHLLFPNPRLRPPAERLEENRLGQSGLWPYGISGDLPIVLITIGEERDLALVRQGLQAHAYWRRHGLKADLVILNEESAGYEQPLRERLERLIQSHAFYTGVDQPGGVFLRSAERIPEQGLTLMRSVAHAVLVAARGTLMQQSGRAPEIPEPMVRKRAPREPSASLPFLELPYFNSLGGFTQDGREYAVYLGPHTHTPAPWVNVIANPTFGTMVSESGAGVTWYGNSQRNRLTAWSNDPVVDPASEAIYIRDENSGEYWTPTASPIREETPYRARHGAGYTVYEHNSHGIEQELTVFVPTDDDGGAPVKLQKLRLRNDSGRKRRLLITYYAEWTVGENRETSQMHVVTSWDDDAKALLAHNRYHPDYGGRVTFAAISPAAESYSGDRTAFLGRNRVMAEPAAMDHVRLSNRIGAGFDPCAALQVAIELDARKTTQIICMLGQAETVPEVRQLVTLYREGHALEAALSRTREWWDHVLGAVEVHTPELATDFLLNRWLLYQSLSCRIWGRSAFYQSGGAFGFRDQLQDALAFLCTRPELAREQILLAASRQFRQGDVQHWWHAPSGAGIRTRISDDLLWLPYVVAQYVRVTGDLAVLEGSIPFLDAPELEAGQHETFQTPEASGERASLFEHCRRAVARSLSLGPHGLPLIGTGDWNDGMNRVGAGGRGESVWLAWFLADVLEGMAELARAIGQPDLSRSYTEQKETLVQQVERHAWDGAWYLRATFDDGTPLGSAANEEARIDSLPQSWAQLCGAANKARAGQALESAWQHLVREDDGLVLLFTPPFDQSQPSPGYIKGYPPGVRENGGQYTHAAVWLAMAAARHGDGTRAVNLLRMLNPIERTTTPEKMRRYGIEPYAVAADVYRLAEHIGQGGWSWYTGSAAWMYRAWIEEILGMKVRFDHLRMDPVLPAAWEGFRLRYRHGEAVYEIEVENPDGCEHGVLWVEMDGQRLPDGRIPLHRDLIKHRIRVRMGVSGGANKSAET